MAKTSRSAGKKGRGVSLHIGLNEVSAAHYDGWTGPLAACELDAKDMAAVAKASGASPTILLTKKATRDNILAAIQAAAGSLKSGDLFVLTYSGHGGQVPDEVKGDEDDNNDETWCLFDGQLLDDELYYELSRFARGVRVLVFSDSCHSGTVTRAAPPLGVGGAARSKMMPPGVGRRTYEQNKTFYDGIQKSIAKKTRNKPVADPDSVLAQIATNPRLTRIVEQFRPAVILISGCQDNQTSLDGDRNGAFTEQVLRVWDEGAFLGSYVKFHGEIRRGLPASQTPNLFLLGKAAGFAKQQPFSV